MLLALACLFATAAASPAYDLRQEGELNVQADVQNILLFIALPKKLPLNIFDLLSKSNKPLDRDHEIQERSDIRVMEAFVEPSTPYRVEIGAGDRSAGDGRAAEVVIAGRRHLDTDSEEQDELKLLGATENCGPDRVRDSVTLMCQDRSPLETVNKLQINEKEDNVESQQTPEVVVVKS